LARRAGSEIGVEGVAEGVEDGGFLVGEQETGLRVSTVLEGVLRDAGLALGSFGAAGFGSVDARGFSALVGDDALWHDWNSSVFVNAGARLCARYQSCMGVKRGSVK